MILDTLAAADRYVALHPRFAAAFAFLRRPDLAALPPGRQQLDGSLLYANVDHIQGRGRGAAVLECHRKYIDIQYVVAGSEEIGWSPLAACAEVELAYEEARDVALYRDRPAAWTVVPPGSFVIYWPEDAHAPLAGTGELRKIVVKVAVDG